MFIDYVKIHLIAGNGGSGCVSFHREKFVAKGGPDGGDGGKGGNIVLKGNRQLRTLRDFRYHREYRSKRGQHGMGSNKHGKGAKDILLKVPLGTMIKEAKTGHIIADIVEDGQTVIAAKGGKGGKGNARFSTSTHQSPREWEVGASGEDKWIELELKLIADVGLVGFPNAGKSTLLSRLSAAKPKIADYPFTTLEPNLGIVTYKDSFSYVVADIPGLIEGAHQGKGLGHQFLRHIERTRALAYMIDVTDEDPLKTFLTLKRELSEYSHLLSIKPFLVILNKMDIADEDFKIPKFESDISVIAVSAATGENLANLEDALHKMVILSQDEE